MPVTLTSGAAVAAGTTTALVTVDESRVQGAVFFLNVTAAAAAGGDTLDVYIQHSPDGGTTWDDFVHFTQALGNGGAKKFIATWRADLTPTTPLKPPADGTLAAGVQQGPTGPDWRVKSVVVGGTALFTYTVSANFRRHN